MYEKLKNFLETTFVLLFDKKWMEAKKVGQDVATCICSATKEVFSDDFESPEFRRDFLVKFKEALCEELDKRIEEI